MLLAELALDPPADQAPRGQRAVRRFSKWPNVIDEVFDKSGSGSSSEDTVFGAGDIDEMIRSVQKRLAQPSSKVVTPSDITQWRAFAPDETRQPRSELWNLLINQARRSAPASIKFGDHASKIDFLDEVVRQFLAAFPDLRRCILTTVLLGFTILETAERLRVTERTAQMTYRAAVDLLRN